MFLAATSDNIFCIFDELYSGTNPYEATASAESFLNYLSDKSNVKYMLTTHYIDICSKLEDNNSNTKNYNMKIIKTKNIYYSMISVTGLDGLKPTLLLSKFSRSLFIILFK